MVAAKTEQPSVRLVQVENEQCTVTVAPEIGGRIVSIFLRAHNNELLWHNLALTLHACSPGTPYDPHFYGGIDEVLPCDLPETIDGVSCPDHGEVWTTPLHVESRERELLLNGTFPQTGLCYERRMTLADDRAELVCSYHLSNPTTAMRHFLWKMHAALAAQPGDIIDCPAKWAQPLDPAYSTCPSMTPFRWPVVDGKDKSVALPADGTCEFLSLYGLAEGRIGWRSPVRGISLTYHFDPNVFPAACLFQSFGGLDGHYVTVIGPATNVPVSVNDAITSGQCASLGPGCSLTTTVRITAAYS